MRPPPPSACVRALSCALLLLGAARAGADPAPSLYADLVSRVGPSIVRLGMFDGEEQQGNGTGFFIREDGVVVTNHHVVDHVVGDFFAVLPDGKKHRVLGSLALDEEHDLAIVKIEGAGFRPLELAAPSSFQAGDAMFLIGSSRGLDQSLGVGVVSAIREDFPEEWKKRDEKAGRKITRGPLVQHTASSAPGSSGSPLVDAQGKVIGVHHSGMIGSPIYFGAHVDLLRALIAKTDLDAKPKPLGPDRMRNLLISLAVVGTIALAASVAWLLQKRRVRAQVRGRVRPLPM